MRLLLQAALASAPAAGNTPWEGDFAPPARASGGFRGAPAAGATLDYNSFLRRFDARELLQEMRGEFLGGAQAAVANYLLALAYASPATASILDMAEHKYAARYAAFAQGRAAPAQAAIAAAPRLALATEQCFAAALGRGEAPTSAWRKCGAGAASASASAASSNRDFLRRYAGASLTPALESLLGLLPDERSRGGALQRSAPAQNLPTLARRIEERTLAALQRIDAGAEPSSIEACEALPLLAPASPFARAAKPGIPAAAPCLPRSALAIVSAGAWRASRWMAPAERQRALASFASEVAQAGSWDAVLGLARFVSGLELQDGADATEARLRLAELRGHVAQLLEEASLQSRLADARASLAQAADAARARAEARLEARTRSLRDRSAPEAIDGGASLGLATPGRGGG